MSNDFSPVPVEYYKIEGHPLITFGIPLVANTETIAPRIDHLE